jgi:hypothetical protein
MIGLPGHQKPSNATMGHMLCENRHLRQRLVGTKAKQNYLQHLFKVSTIKYYPCNPNFPGATRRHSYARSSPP